MGKSYFNNAVVGNSKMLGCLTDRGELIRLYWPHIDFEQHVDRLKCGIFIEGINSGTLWLDEGTWKSSQVYVDNTNIALTTYSIDNLEVSVDQYDYVLPEREVLVRKYVVHNRSNFERRLCMVAHGMFISTQPDPRGTLFDFDTDSMIFYKNAAYFAMTANREIEYFQIGNNSFEAASHMNLKGTDNIGMMNDGAFSTALETVRAGTDAVITIYICASPALNKSKETAREIKNTDADQIYGEVKAYWLDFLKGSTKAGTGNKKIDDLYNRTVLYFKLMSDRETGGLLASPEVDEGNTRCGRYAYCWGRDAAFITGAMDKCGLTGAVDKFYQWAVNAQDNNGVWHQRYHLDGNLAPSWGIQIDETGTIVWGMLQHFKITKNIHFLEYVWGSVKLAACYMLDNLDENGLPMPSFDLWEERYGEHTYSASAVYGGIMAAVEISSILNKREHIVNKWQEKAEGIKDAILRELWNDEKGCFLRSIKTKLNPWGDEYSSHKTVIKYNSKGYYKDVTLEDATVDVSLLGVSIPFGVLDIEDPNVESTARSIEKFLKTGKTGLVMRYEHDNYMGGNPWLLASLWVSLYHIKKGNYDEAMDYFNKVASCTTGMGLLPEQADKDTGNPVWIYGLTWSHAMFILVLFELIEAGKYKQ